MKAVILKDKMKKGNQIAPLYYEDVETPQPKKGEVLVRLHYAAVNHRDVYIRYGAYPGIAVPAIIGSDGAGVIAALGEGVSHITIGSEVMINPGLDWGENIAFPQANHSVLGVPSDGTYAQYVTVPAENVVEKPSYLTMPEAAAIPLAALTAYRAVVTKGEIKPTDTVIIPGVGGGVATFVLQIAVAKGARVFVTSSSEEKIAYAMALGAAGGVNYRSEGWARELKALSGGADVSIDSIGGSTFNDLIYLAKPGSRIVSFGATLGPIEQLVMPRIFLKQLHILGTTMGSAVEFRAMLDFYESHKLKPVIDGIYDLQNIESVHEKMDKGNVFGKMVLKIPQD